VLARDARALTVDLSGVTFVDSTGLRYLLTLAQHARRDAFDLELVPPAASVMRLFDLTGTRDVLPFKRAA
jgi:anti-anti-sigma factor